ncbi:hypothetical protein CCR75_002562 [Bremia lactucae]|uniref:Uncharacterized protein n=1 Tax=Bremia lactucae TaxID=4779 RepID=A0A976IEV6_BRELC|nr:hypothetical protein CCR75_002562 [Bremia lactucae]
MARQLRLREFITPATGNCMVMATVQALSDIDLSSAELTLSAETDSLKRGIKYTGQLSHSKRTAIVHDHNWGGCEMLCVAANFLLCKIYVIAKGGSYNGQVTSVAVTNCIEMGENFSCRRRNAINTLLRISKTRKVLRHLY